MLGDAARRRRAARPGGAGGVQLAVQHRPRAGDPPAGDGPARQPRGRESAWDPERARRSPRSPTSSAAATSTTSHPGSAAFPDTMHVRLPRASCSPTRSRSSACGRRLGVDPAAAPAPARERRQRERGSRHPALSDELRGTLEAYFEASDRALSARLGRACPGGPDAERGARRVGRELTDDRSRRAAGHPVQRRPRSRAASWSTSQDADPRRTPVLRRDVRGAHGGAARRAHRRRRRC